MSIIFISTASFSAFAVVSNRIARRGSLICKPRTFGFGHLTNLQATTLPQRNSPAQISAPICRLYLLPDITISEEIETN